MTWQEELNALGVDAVARAVGLEVRGRCARPCPACRAERRGSSDGRGPVGFGRGWKCHACRRQGDAVMLASWRLLGEEQPTTPDGWEGLLQAAAPSTIKRTERRR